jgi:hypothetical protein
MLIPYRDVIALRALDDARRAVELSEEHIACVQHEADDLVHDQVCLAFTTLAAIHLGEETSRALFECLVGTGDDIEECLASVTGAPQAFVVVAGDGHTYRVDRVCLSAERAHARADDLTSTRAFQWVNVQPVELDSTDPGAEDALSERLSNPCPDGHPASTSAAPAPEETLPWEDRVGFALATVFPAAVARDILAAEAFGALVFRVREHAQATGLPPAAVLARLDVDTRLFAAQADEPAAFLASRVARLPL